MKLIVATCNPSKLQEIREIFKLPCVQLVSPVDYPGLPPVVEDGATLEANSVKKAVTVALAAGLWTMADDSGLEVEVLDGAPGVRSARYGGEPVSHKVNNRKLLKELQNVTNRKARFRCVVALSSPTGSVRIVEGKCEGWIVDSSRGANGFGYDPIFMPDGHNRTFAEMESTVKNRISHRAAALDLARKAWGELLSNQRS